MEVLEAALRPVARILNRNISESTPARELCAQLSGTVVAIRVRNTALAAYFVIDDDALNVVTATSQEPDVVITGSLITLASMAGEAAVRDRSLDLTGDAQLAAQFQRLLGRISKKNYRELSVTWPPTGSVNSHAASVVGVAKRDQRWVPTFANTCRKRAVTLPAATKSINSLRPSTHYATMLIALRRA
jgi:ubiquinone biosynthesis protein UbiJ